MIESAYTKEGAVSVVPLCNQCHTHPEMLDGLCLKCWHTHKQQQQEQQAWQTAIAKIKLTPTQRNKNLQKYRHERKRLLVEALGGVCFLCGGKPHFWAFAFVGEPAYPITQGLSRGYKFQTLLKEAQKCKLLCLNCEATQWYETHKVV